MYNKLARPNNRWLVGWCSVLLEGNDNLKQMDRFECKRTSLQPICVPPLMLQSCFAWVGSPNDFTFSFLSICKNICNFCKRGSSIVERYLYVDFQLEKVFLFSFISFGMCKNRVDYWKLDNAVSGNNIVVMQKRPERWL